MVSFEYVKTKSGLSVTQQESKYKVRELKKSPFILKSCILNLGKFRGES